MKKIIALLMVLVMTLGLAACGKDEGTADGKVLKIGVIQLVKHDALDRAYQGFVDELEKQGYVDGENIEIDYQVASNEQANCLTIAESMVNDNNDLISRCSYACRSGRGKQDGRHTYPGICRNGFSGRFGTDRVQ